jgi:hypothetical protein
VLRKWFWCYRYLSARMGEKITFSYFLFAFSNAKKLMQISFMSFKITAAATAKTTPQIHNALVYNKCLLDCFCYVFCICIVLYLRLYTTAKLKIFHDIHMKKCSKYFILNNHWLLWLWRGKTQTTTSTKCIYCSIMTIIIAICYLGERRNVLLSLFGWLCVIYYFLNRKIWFDSHLNRFSIYFTDEIGMRTFMHNTDNSSKYSSFLCINFFVFSLNWK